MMNTNVWKKKFQRIVLIACILASAVFFICLHQRQSDQKIHMDMNQWMYGITIDDCWYDDVSTKQIVAAIQEMPVKPTVRIVMSKEISPGKYRKLFSEIHKSAYIMASPVDSYDMKKYKDEASYMNRFQASYKELASDVDLWEIGNEINGVEWIQQDPKLIINKVIRVNDYIKAKGAKTALTMYYTNPKDADMFRWISKHVPKELSEHVDYAFISYYEDDNEGYTPKWNTVFRSYQRAFPHSGIGIGECGNTAADASVSSKMKMAHAYYTMKKYSTNYVGGYFWWNWVEDCVPHSKNPVYKEINRSMIQGKTK